MPAPLTLAANQNVPAMVAENLDPRLQLLIAQRRAGMTRAASSSTDANEAAVVARVRTFAQWEALSEVRTPLLIGPSPNLEGFIVTGRIPISRIESVRTQGFVLSLKAAQELRPMLQATTQETAATAALLPAGHLADGGSGVVIGIVDYGGDFAHQNFRNADGTTRLLSLWYQDGPTTAASPFGYGRAFSRQDLNLALQNPNPYSASGYNPGVASHGTHVMDIAGGNGRGSGVAGLAHRAELIFVNISHGADPQGTVVVGKSFGDSTRLLESLRYIFDQAGNRPCVINVSLGTNGGPHDGTTLVEQGIDSLVTAAPNRAVVLAAANAFDDGIHAAGVVAQDAAVDLGWELIQVPSNNIELEVWYPGGDRFAVDVFAPNGDLLISAEPGVSRVSLADTGEIAIFLANRLNDPNNHDNSIHVFFSAGMPTGAYRVRLRGVAVANGQYHAWIERDNNFPSRFVNRQDNTHTIGSISCGHQSIAVGSYDGHKVALPLSYFSSAGPTRDGRRKPEISAPGHDVLAAESRSETGVTRMSGTSMASPAVAGVVALMFAEARARGIDLNIAQVRDILIRTSRRNPPAGQAWDDRFGNGRVSAAAALAEVIALAAGNGGGGAGGNAATMAEPVKPKRKARVKKKAEA